MDLHGIISRAAERAPGKTALIFRERETTYADLVRTVEGRALGLLAEGVRPGDRVGIHLPNSPEFVEAYFAVTSLGAVAVPMNTLLKQAELGHILSDSGTKTVITTGNTRFPGVERLVLVRHAGSVPARVVTPGATVRRWEDIWRGGDLPVADRERELAVVLYTSGTTGRPKGAMLTHANLVSNAEGIGLALDAGPRDVHLCVLPMFHTFAATVCMNMPLLTGGTIVIMDQFVPAGVLRLIEQHRVTVFAGVPAMYVALNNARDGRGRDLGSLRACVAGGAALPMDVFRQFEERFGVRIVEGYGLSEAAPVVSVNPACGPVRPGSVGLPIPGVRVRVVDEAGRDVPPGEVGEILVQGPNVMIGYYGLDLETREAMLGGWLRTGDLGRVDGDGYLYIVDRKKDLINVGGYKVYPREVEETLYRHPTVMEAVAVGRPDPARGEVVVAHVALGPGAQVSSRDLIAFCRRHLANYKVPVEIMFRESLPKTGSGKLARRLLREESGPAAAN
ncbi:MAG: long-chain fatty acid--CoA ligase [Firmicutes bacterium]|jgi:long-chain acyl-CoA synthetase|nr:long-chain fatty acid--CoA ligase [Bacillota bacterium]